MTLDAKLVVVGGDVKTTEIKLRLPSVIGRGKSAGIVLAHPLVSRQHCELFESGGQLMVRDLGSLNGTFVNNERVTESPLANGELLTIGTVTFRAVYEPASAADPSSRTVNAAKAQATVRIDKPEAPTPAKGTSISPPKGEDVTVHVEQWQDQDENEPPPSSSDDDLNDFLKSLEE